MSYVGIFTYIFIRKYENILAYVCLGFLGVSLILIALSYVRNNPNFNLFTNHLLVFLLTIYLKWKIIHIACYLNTPENDNDDIIIRSIAYDFVAVNMAAFVLLDPTFSVFASLFLLNFAGTLVGQFKSNSNHFYYLDGLSNIPTAFLLYLFKKEWEGLDRANFADKYRFEKFYHYTRDFIKGLNGYYLNITDDFSVFCDSKMKTLLNDMQIEKNIEKLTTYDKILDVNNTAEINKLNEINCSMTPNLPIGERNNGYLSPTILKLFTSYDENDMKNGNSKGKKENLEEKLKIVMLEPSTINFINVGQFKLVSILKTKYFDVSFRKFSLDENNTVNDIMMNDITELITSKQKIWEEGIIKGKIMAKVVHEFKTPINSIIGVIANIEDSIKSSNIQQNKTTMKHLETIRSLSSYVIFLISDIIHFTNVKSLEEIKIIPQKINLKEISNFSYDILKSLLRCNKSKEDAIKPILEFEAEINSLHIEADEIRLKQIFLNIISNAVKFTKSGLIKIKCSIMTIKQAVIISISDTGIGIPENEHEKLFNDFHMINNDAVNNSMGSGLGLSICKSLAASMNIELSTTSTYGKGSEFSLAIPFLPHSPKCASLLNIFLHENSFKKDIENDISLQEINPINKLSIPEISNRSCSNSNNEGVSQELSKKDIDSLRIECQSDASTIKLGNDYVFSKINRINGNGIKSPNMSHSSRIYLNNSANDNKPSRNNTIEIKEKRDKILIVDDNHYNCESTKNILQKVLKEAGSNMEIIIGTDGDDIIHYIINDQSKGNEIKCIITDENMEYINGSQAIRTIRDLERRNKIKFVNIISVTGNEESESINEIKKAGAQLVLSKPLPRTMITNALKELNII